MDLFRVKFSSDNIPATSDAVRARTWSENLGAFGFTFDNPRTDGFKGVIDIVGHGDTVITMAMATSAVAQRDMGRISADGDDRLFLFINAGDRPLVAEQGGRQAVLRQNEAAVVYRDEPSVTRALDAGCAIGVLLPRRIEAGLGRGQHFRTAMTLAPNPALSLLRSYAKALGASPQPMPPSVLASAFVHLGDLALLALGADARTSSRERQTLAGSVRAALVVRHVEDNALDPRLDVDRVATRFGLSPRSVQAIFTARGTGFSDFVRERRLKAARAMIEWRGPNARSIADVAFDCGFESLSAFYRAWRAAYPDTPGDVIARVTAGPEARSRVTAD